VDPAQGTPTPGFALLEADVEFAGADRDEEEVGGLQFGRLVAGAAQRFGDRRRRARRFPAPASA
jgi:hypothetical protein